MNAKTYSGLDLKLARISRRVKQKPIGDAMGVSVSRISALEREAVVTDETAARYLLALDTCSTGTSGAAA